jgi:hypothetical protein
MLGQERLDAVGAEPSYTLGNKALAPRRVGLPEPCLESNPRVRCQPRASLADVLARLADHPANRIAEMLPWNWKTARLHPEPKAA